MSLASKAKNALIALQQVPFPIKQNRDNIISSTQDFM